MYLLGVKALTLLGIVNLFNEVCSLVKRRPVKQSATDEVFELMFEIKHRIRSYQPDCRCGFYLDIAYYKENVNKNYLDPDMTYFPRKLKLKNPLLN